MRHKFLTAFAAVAILAAPLGAMAAPASPPKPMKVAYVPHHKRHIVHVTGTILAIDIATGRITLSNHHRYHFKNASMASRYKVGQKITLSFWA